MSERLNKLVKKYKIVEQKMAEVVVDIDKEMLKVRNRMQQLQDERNKVLYELENKKKMFKDEIDAEMLEYEKLTEKKTYDAGLGKVSVRVTHALVCDDEEKALKFLKGTGFVREKIELDKNKIKNEMTKTDMKKFGFKIAENKSVTVK